MTAEQLRAGAAIDLIANKFRGLAQSEIATFSGALAQAQNAFGDILESIGQFVTRSGAIVGLVRGFAQVFANLSAAISNTGQDVDLFREPLLRVINVLQQFGPTAINIFVQASRAFNLFFNSVVTGIDALVRGFGILVGAAAKVASFFGADGELTQALTDFDNFTKEQLNESVRNLNNDISKLGEPVDTSGLTESLQIIEESVANTRASVGGASLIPGLGTSDTEQEEAQKAFDTFGVRITTLQSKTQEFGKNFVAVSKQIQNAAVQGIGGGIGRGFTAFGAALAKGENAIAAFGKAFLASIGQAAAALGQRFILEGIAISFNPLLGGPSVGGPLIAAGAALATFGGLLGGLSGGGGSAGAVGTGGGIGAAATNDPNGFNSTVDQVEEREDPEQRVSLTVNGDVLDSQETGTRILNILQENFESTGSTIIGGSFA